MALRFVRHGFPEKVGHEKTTQGLFSWLFKRLNAVDLIHFRSQSNEWVIQENIKGRVLTQWRDNLSCLWVPTSSPLLGRSFWSDFLCHGNRLRKDNCSICSIEVFLDVVLLIFGFFPRTRSSCVWDPVVVIRSLKMTFFFSICFPWHFLVLWVSILEAGLLSNTIDRDSVRDSRLQLYSLSVVVYLYHRRREDTGRTFSLQSNALETMVVLLLFGLIVIIFSSWEKRGRRCSMKIGCSSLILFLCHWI